MPSYLRWKLTGATYFFTVITHSRRWLFVDSAHRRILKSCFHDARVRFPYDIDAVVLLPDHLHVLMRPAEGVDYSSLWRFTKTLFTRRLIAHQRMSDQSVAQDAGCNLVHRGSTGESVHQDAPYKGDAAGKLLHQGALCQNERMRDLTDGRRPGEASVWQRRFYEHTIRDEMDWGRHVDYIHWNPVKHGLAARPQDWKWSSIHRFIRKGLLVPMGDTNAESHTYVIPE